MQISSDLKSLELLGISGKGRLQFCELNLRQFKYPEVQINSKKFSIP